MGYYRQHIFFCLNQKSPGKTCCASGGAEPLFEYARQRIKSMGLHHQGELRVSKAGCLGRCKEGPSVVIYPDNVWYRVSTEQDVDKIIEQHLVGGQPVAELTMAKP